MKQWIAATLRVAAWPAFAGAQKAASCQACHGAEGESVMPLYPDLAGQHAPYLLQAYRRIKRVSVAAARRK